MATSERPSQSADTFTPQQLEQHRALFEIMGVDQGIAAFRDEARHQEVTRLLMNHLSKSDWGQSVEVMRAFLPEGAVPDALAVDQNAAARMHDLIEKNKKDLGVTGLYDCDKPPADNLNVGLLQQMGVATFGKESSAMARWGATMEAGAKVLGTNALEGAYTTPYVPITQAVAAAADVVAGSDGQGDASTIGTRLVGNMVAASVRDFGERGRTSLDTKPHMPMGSLAELGQGRG